MSAAATADRSLSLNAGRLSVVAAAVLWSTSGALTKLLREDTPLGTPLGLNAPPMDGQLIAFSRVLIAGLFLAPLVRPRALALRPMMLVTACFFAAMNVLFVTALAEGSAANAILLQYTAPMWMYLVSVLVLGEAADRRGAVALGIGLAGIAGIIAGGWHAEQLGVILVALGSGVAYAGVIIGLRVLRHLDSAWISVFNLLFSAVVLVPLVWDESMPTLPQVGVLLFFGAFQLGLPYLLMARGLRTVSPQEAGTLCLLEPVLNPLWAYLVSPATDTPSAATLVGGGFILAALAYRYWPFAGK